MSTKAACYKDLRVQVNITYCNPRSRPSTGVLPCNTRPCPPSWSLGDWSVCSRTCGSGQQSRLVQCVRRTSPTEVDVVNDRQCVQPPPSHRQPCNTHICPPSWSPGPWSQCSRKCGKGMRKRTVTCVSSSQGSHALVLPDSECAALPRPQSQESCLLKRCPKQPKAQWILSTWQQCSVTCGKGVQVRSVRCAEKDVGGKYRDLAVKKCQHVPKPSVELQRVCIQPDCPSNPRQYRPDWYTSPWSQCTVSCGGGIQVRSVQCLAHGRPSSGCSAQQKPAASQACNVAFCPQHQPQDTACKDFFNWCYLVPQHGVCGHKFYGKQCCRSCLHTNF